ncbi:MFS transporter [Amycolatopsis aidingensis]|uniref:MFS transporter n=1 Tax=Amycolatopsis aidingensis TaxID=2842453 RepID=UPI001C0C6782|nr:MFS transporter [Amycolatopsis aidingensis]
MSTPQVTLSRVRTNLILTTLFFGVFVLGCAELLVVGMLDLLADDLEVSIPTTGTLVTSYALGMAIGGPLLTALTIKLARRAVLAGALIVFALANLAPVLFTDYALFVVARGIDGAAQGLFVAVAFGVGTSIVPSERAGRAISVIISGVAVSAALGVPLGTAVGQTLGWRGSFIAIVVISLMVLVATLVLVPFVPSTGGGGAAGQAKYAFAPRVLAVLGLNLVVFTSLYTALTYIVPFLQEVTGIAGVMISVFLFAYGLANAVGSFSGGRFADKNAAGTLIVGTAGSAAALLVLYFVGTNPILVAVTMLVWGLFAFIMVPSLQLRVVNLAGPGGELAHSLPASAVNVGVALGPVAGGVALSSSTSAPMLVGMFIALAGVVIAVATSRLKPPVVPEETEPAATVPEETAKAT